MHACSIRGALTVLCAVTLVACAGKATAPAAPSREAVAAATPATSVALRPADEARASVGVVVTSAPPESLAAELDGFARDADLPMPLGQSALDVLVKELAGGVPLSREQLSRLAATESLALVALFPEPLTPEMCAAFAFKDAALATKTADELGPAGRQEQGVTLRTVSLGSEPKAKKQSAEIWTAVIDKTLLVASSPHALVAGGALAIEAQHAPRDGQIVATVRPQAIAPRVALAAGIEAGAASIDEDLQKELPGGKGKRITPAMRRMLVAGFKAMASPVLYAESVRLAVRLDGKNGFLVQTDVQAEKSGAAAHPFVFEAALPVVDDRTAVFAMSERPAAIDGLETAMAASGPAGKNLARELDTLLSTLIAGGSCAVTFAPAPMSGICAYPLRPGITPKRALDGYAALLKDVQPWNDEVLGPGKAKTKVKRSKDLIELETTQLDPDPASRAMRASLMGGDTVKSAIVVRDGKLWQAQGPKPRELLQQIGAEKRDLGQAPILATTLARDKEAEGLFYFDFMSMMSATAKGVEDPSVKQVRAMMAAVPGLTELRAPLVLTLRGGRTAGVDVQIPFQSLANVARVVKPFIGRMGSAP